MITEKINTLIRRLQFQIWYYRRPPWDTLLSPPELQTFIQYHPAGRALDLGCGTGTNLLTLAQAGWQVTGVDFAWRAVQIARRRLRDHGFRADVQLGDVTELNGIPGPFDLILDIGCYHNLSRRGRKVYQNKLDALLADNGTFLIYAHYKSELRAGNHGIDAEDEEQFGCFLRLIDKQIGEDRHRGASVWLTYQLERSS